MKYLVRVGVEGEVYIQQETRCLSAQRGDLTFELRSDDTGCVTEVSVSRDVPPERIERYRSSVGPGEGDSAATFHIGGDREMFDALLSELHYFESALSFWVRGALRRFIWHSYATEIIAETPEEQALAPVSGFSFKTGYPDARWLVRPSGLRAVLNDPTYESLGILKAFWREGMTEFSQLRYIQAFYNFYFVLEDLYAGGAFAKNETLNRFRKSTEFSNITATALKSIGESSPKHIDALEKLAKDLGCDTPRDIEAAWKLLVAVRGGLHHYTSKGGPIRGTPYNQRDFESPAFFVMYLASSALERRQNAGRRDSSGNTESR